MIPSKNSKDKPIAMDIPPDPYDEGMRLFHEHKYHDSFKKIQEAARLDHPQALLQMAEMLLAGQGIEQDRTQALDFFRQAAVHKDASIHAMYRYGCVLEDPTMPDNNPEKGLAWLQTVAKAGHPDACYRLARMLLGGRGSVFSHQSLTNAHEWLIQATKAESVSKEESIKHRLLLAATSDRLGEHETALKALTEAADNGSPYAQLQLGLRYLCGVDKQAISLVTAREWLRKAAKGPIHYAENPDPAGTLAKALLTLNLESIPTEKLRSFLRRGNDFEGPISIGIDPAGRRTVTCCMRKPAGSEGPTPPGGPVKKEELKPVQLTVVENKLDSLTQFLKKNLEENPTSEQKEDEGEQALGVALYADLLDSECGLREFIPLATITEPPPPEPELELELEPKPESSAESQRIVIMRSGHHCNNWLSAMGDVDRIMPTLLKYLNRDWKRDIAERNSGLEWLPQRLHLSLGKPTFGDVYVGKIGVGCSVWMYTILSTPPPTLRPEIHTVFPVVVAKARKYFLKVDQILEWHNRIEATMMADIDHTIDANKVEKGYKKKSDSPAPSAETKMPAEGSSAAADPKKKSGAFPLFGIDFFSRRNIWEGKGLLEVFLSAIGSVMIRNPEQRKKMESKPAVPSFDEDGEEIQPQGPRSVVPDDYAKFDNKSGVWPHEGPMKENRGCHIRGRCIKTVKLPGTLWGKSAVLVTVRIDEERELDVDVWCLKQHILDGQATISPGEPMSIPAGGVPVPGDTVHVEGWFHGTIATGLDPVPTPGVEVNATEDKATPPTPSLAVTDFFVNTAPAPQLQAMDVDEEEEEELEVVDENEENQSPHHHPQPPG